MPVRVAWFGAGWAAEGPASFEAPLETRSALTVDAVAPCVAWAEAEAQAGRWVILVLAYEAAPAFDPALVTRTPIAGLPLAWAASFHEAKREDTPPGGCPGNESPALTWTPRIDEARFHRDVAVILERIAAGDTYQVNYTFPLDAAFAGEPHAWFAEVAARADAPYTAFVDLGSHVVMSLSPELFLERTGSQLLTRPMKGTARRGRWLEEDRRLSADLVASQKARAENVMIVDLLRNDLGRVAVPGSVRVRDLCGLERYPTVWQLTSTVEARAVEGTSLCDVLRAVFPCGSVTGAPKVATMGIIEGLEAAARGIYTGAIGLLRPGGDATFSVPIRTGVLDRAAARLTFHVGAGITADSVAAEEWAECLAKSRVVRPPAVPDDVSLLETMRLEEGVLVRREGHLRRLLDSAALFGWSVPRADVDAALDSAVSRHPSGLWRMRLVVSRNGGVAVTATPFTPDQRIWRVTLAPTAVDVRSPLLFNKTTRRVVYDIARAARPEHDDVLLWNARGELTESTLANIVLEIDGRKVTPPVASGLLPGVMRAELLASGEIEEAVVPVSDLGRASRVWLVNSLRGWMPAQVS